MSGTGQSERLAAELERMQALAMQSSILEFETEGDPPTVYKVTLRGKGLKRRSSLGEEVEYVELHEVRIRLGYAYPQQPPEVHWLTPIFHPNISATGHILDKCGLSWKEELTLDIVCERLWDLARGAYVDEERPSNLAAKKWFAEQRELAMPVDHRPLRDRGRPPAGDAVRSRRGAAGGEPTPHDAGRQPEEKAPVFQEVHDFLLYHLSLPERSLRSASAVASGVMRESASLLVPQAFRNSKTYHVMIRQMLDFLAEDVGGVQRSEDPTAPPRVESFVARKAVGNFVEMVGLSTLHLSPLLLLAVVSDVAYGSQAYLKELADELKKKGVIDRDSTIDHADDLLEAVAGSAETVAAAFDTPPLSVEGLRQTIEQTHHATRAIDPGKVIPQGEIQRLWNEIHETATTQGADPFAVSSAITLLSLDKIGSLGQGSLSTVTAAGTLLDRHVLDHYTAGLNDIREQGIYTVLAEASEPYVDAVWTNFSTEKTTITEDLLSGKLIGEGWSAVRRWLGGGF